jgi:hypothetical protein
MTTRSDTAYSFQSEISLDTQRTTTPDREAKSPHSANVRRLSTGVHRTLSSRSRRGKRRRKSIHEVHICKLDRSYIFLNLWTWLLSLVFAYLTDIITVLIILLAVE